MTTKTQILIDYPEERSRLGDLTVAHTEILPKTKIWGNGNSPDCKINLTEGSLFAVRVHGWVDKGETAWDYDQIIIYRAKKGSTPPKAWSNGMLRGFPFKDKFPKTNCEALWGGDDADYNTSNIWEGLKERVDNWETLVKDYKLK
jgi:hypothetical protein